MKAVTCPCILTGASTRSDGSLSLKFATPELAPDEKTAFFELLNLNLKILLQPADSQPAELKEVKGQFDKKTHSQRLRAVLYVFWKQCSEQGEFEEFYRRRMDELIEMFKKKLEPK
jgi:hypothetical protein